MDRTGGRFPENRRRLPFPPRYTRRATYVRFELDSGVGYFFSSPVFSFYRKPHTNRKNGGKYFVFSMGFPYPLLPRLMQSDFENVQTPNRRRWPTWILHARTRLPVRVLSHPFTVYGVVQGNGRTRQTRKQTKKKIKAAGPRRKRDKNLSKG